MVLAVVIQAPCLDDGSLVRGQGAAGDATGTEERAVSTDDAKQGPVIESDSRKNEAEKTYRRALALFKELPHDVRISVDWREEFSVTLANRDTRARIQQTSTA